MALKLPTVCTSVPLKLKERIAAAAKRAGVSESGWVRAACVQRLEREEPSSDTSSDSR